MLEPEEHCSFITKWTVPHLWAKLTHDPSTDCAATMATRHHVCACQKMIKLLAKLEPWTTASAFLGLISKVQSYARAGGTLLIYKQTDSSSLVGQVYQ